MTARMYLKRQLLIASVLGCAVAVAGCEGRSSGTHAAGGKTGAVEDAPRRTGPAIAVLDLAGGVPEQEASSLLGQVGKRRSFDELIRTINELATDTKKEDVGVLVKLGSASIGGARAQEIGEQLDALKAKKKVYCHADGLSNATMMLAARGCSKIWISPAGDVETVGIAAQMLYFHRLLADELHLTIDFLQVGKFKGAEEPFTRDGPSPEARASLTGVLTDFRTAWIDTTNKGRPKPNLAELLEDGPYAPNKAKELGLVDEVGYAIDALSALKKDAEAVREEAEFGAGAEEKGGDLEEIVRVLAGDSGELGPIVLMRLTGSIGMTTSGGILGSRAGISEKEVDRTLRQIEKDDEVKALVIRLDSPGGSALASDLMWHHLMRVRKKKPVVISIGDMAASGGMYLASTGDFIYADSMSMVGSIGVVGGKIAIGDALETIGVHAETIAANTQNPNAAARAATESFLTKWDEPTKVRMLESMTSVYELFLARVSEGRSTRGRTISRDKVAESAEGRVFAAIEGKKRGLVDEIGGLTAAIAKARELAELNESARVAVISQKPTFLDALEPSGAPESKMQAAEAHVRDAVSPFALLDRLAPELVPFASSVAPLAEGQHVVVALPFSLTVK